MESKSFQSDFSGEDSDAGAPEVPESIDLEAETHVERGKIIVGRGVRRDRGRSGGSDDGDDRVVPPGNRFLARRQSAISAKAYSWREEQEMSPSTANDFAQISTSATTSSSPFPPSSSSSSSFPSSSSSSSSSASSALSSSISECLSRADVKFSKILTSHAMVPSLHSEGASYSYPFRSSDYTDAHAKSRGSKSKKGKTGVFGSPTSGPLKANHTVVTSGGVSGGKRKQHQWTSVYRAPPHSLITNAKPKSASSGDDSRHAWSSSKNLHRSSPLSPKSLAKKGSKGRRKRGQSAKYEIVSSPVNSQQAAPSSSRTLFSGNLDLSAAATGKKKTRSGDESKSARSSSRGESANAKQRRAPSAKGSRKGKPRFLGHKREAKLSKSSSSSLTGVGSGKKVLIIGSNSASHSAVGKAGRSLNSIGGTRSNSDSSSRSNGGIGGGPNKTVVISNKIGISGSTGNNGISRGGIGANATHKAPPVDDDLVVDDIEDEVWGGSYDGESKVKRGHDDEMSRDLNAMWNASVNGIVRRQGSPDKNKGSGENAKTRSKVHKPSPPKEGAMYASKPRRGFGESKSEVNVRSFSPSPEEVDEEEAHVVERHSKHASTSGGKVRCGSGSQTYYQTAFALVSSPSALPPSLPSSTHSESNF